VLQLICKTIYKQESGDIRAMLNIARRIFDTKLKKHIEELIPIQNNSINSSGGLNLFGSDLQLNSVLNKITTTDASLILKEKYETRTVDVIQTLGISTQVTLFSLYYTITDQDETCNIVIIIFEFFKKINPILAIFEEKS
jgi:hypothetical protein